MISHYGDFLDRDDLRPEGLASLIRGDFLERLSRVGRLAIDVRWIERLPSVAMPPKQISMLSLWMIDGFAQIHDRRQTAINVSEGTFAFWQS
jgi:hypothetical protein